MGKEEVTTNFSDAADDFKRQSDSLANWYRGAVARWRLVGNDRMVLLASLAVSAVEDYADAFGDWCLTAQQESVKSRAAEEDKKND